MIVTSTPSEQRIVLQNSWQTFEALLRETGENRGLDLLMAL